MLSDVQHLINAEIRFSYSERDIFSPILQLKVRFRKNFDFSNRPNLRQFVIFRARTCGRQLSSSRVALMPQRNPER